MHNIYLLLGSNLGNRENWLYEAGKRIALQVGKISVCSSLYRTAAWGKADEPEFINQVLLVKTDKLPEEVLDIVLNIEIELGRKRDKKWGSRIIDIDILFYDDLVIDNTNLVIPHPYLHERRFTLDPLQEIAPQLEHPVFKQTITELSKNLTDTLTVTKIK